MAIVDCGLDCQLSNADWIVDCRLPIGDCQMLPGAPDPRPSKLSGAYGPRNDSNVMDINARIFVAGHRGLVGSALVRRLQAVGARHVLTAARDDLDLRNQAAVNGWFDSNRPDYVFLTAGTVGGIVANSMRPADFTYDHVLV